MVVTMVYLITLSSQWRLASPANDIDKAANLKAIMSMSFPICQRGQGLQLEPSFAYSWIACQLEVGTLLGHRHN